jgi:hypothetical protein
LHSETIDKVNGGKRVKSESISNLDCLCFFNKSLFDFVNNFQFFGSWFDFIQIPLIKFQDIFVWLQAKVCGNLIENFHRETRKTEEVSEPQVVV